MFDDRCTKHFPKTFVGTKKVDVEGYMVYLRRNDGGRILKNGIRLENICLLLSIYFISCFS